ncbi:hypothetical protein FQR65_LT12051 [Abscondita terminalis]|nr:hypothetical protein FQR65_LT12051 [Abscondita terminalis]
MMWLTVTVSVLTITSAIKIPNTLPEVKNSPSVSLTRSSINSNNNANNRTPYLIYLPQIKKAFVNNKKYIYLHNSNIRFRPSNLEEIIPLQRVNALARDHDNIYKKIKWKRTKREANNPDSTFVPKQLLAQTRRISRDQFLPVESLEPHLRETVKDTKVHIEYTEEGYEDIGYDHADEEVQKESDENYNSETTDRTRTREIDIEKEFNNYEKNYEDEGVDETPKTLDKSIRNPRFTKNDQINTIEKYPHYYDEILDQKSALRYGTNTNNILKKVHGDLSFYKHTGAFKCNEIPINVNPLPNGTHSNATSILPGPRLTDLGEKVKCLAEKYFGANPFDNPLFAETNIETPQPFLNLRRRKRSLTSDAQLIKRNDLDEPLPESSPLRLRKRRRKYPPSLPRPVFFGSSYFPTSMPPLLTFSSTIIPKYKTISEVYYKDEIQPNEQLNVFADVMNNIKKIRTDLVGADTELVEDKTVPYETKTERSRIKLRVPTKRIKIRQSNAKLPEIPAITSTSTTTEKSPTRRRTNIKNHKTGPQVYEEYLHTVKNVKEKQPPKENNKIKQSLKEETSNDVDETELEEVLGLSPPIEIPSSSSTLLTHTFLNTFPVSGMKPPLNRNPLIYSNFNNLKIFKNNFHVIRKRNLQKPGYSEIRRNKPQQPSELEEDDYVPKRNRNFHYDTESKQVVYTKPELIESEEDEPVPIEHKTDEKIISTELPIPSTTIQTGPSFLDYVYQLKSDKQYQYIKEPTEKPKVVTTTTTEQYKNTPQTNFSTPDYLNIVNNLKQNDGYVAIPEKTTKATTTKMPEIEEHVEDSDEFQIFDITEYLPKQEIPSVTIDYSKYKTIQRKMVNKKEDTEDSLIDLSTTSTTTTTTEAVLTTTKRIRSRTRRRPIVSTTEPSSTKPSRQINRRFRSSTQPTTEATSEIVTVAHKRRRLPTRSLSSDQKVPTNHKEVYTPIKGLDADQMSDSIQEETSTHELETDQEVVQKTTAFHSDTTLPKSVNQLKEVVKYKNLNITQKPETQLIVEDLNLNKIKIIKDPSKRLYYYAPVR